MEHSTQRGQLAAAQRRQAARRAAPQQPAARRARRRRHPVLPVAGLAGGRREVPLRPGAARRHRHPALARGRRARRRPSRPSRRWPAATADNQVAILFDWNAWWACELDSHPSIDVRYLDRAEAFHRALTDRGVGVDVVHPDTDLSAYRLVVVPTLYLVSDATWPRAGKRPPSAAPRSWSPTSAASSTSTTTSGSAAIPGASATCSGSAPRSSCRCAQDEHVRARATSTTADIWTEHLELAGAEAVADYVDGPAAGHARGHPARGRRRARRGTSPPASTGRHRRRSSTAG